MPQRNLLPSLVLALASLFTARSVLAEAPAIVAYVNRTTGECGVHITSSAHESRAPLDPAFGPIVLPGKNDECQRLLHEVWAYPDASRTPSKDLLGDAATTPPCQRLASSLPLNPEHTCKALGYRYVGELRASIQPCYPSLAPFLGASCAPLIWIHLAVLIVSLGLASGLAYVVLARRAQRRRALAAAARDDDRPDPEQSSAE